MRTPASAGTRYRTGIEVGDVAEGAKDRRETWLRACERCERLASANPFFTPLAGVVRALADAAYAEAVVPRVDGVDVHLVRAASPGDALAPHDAASSAGLRLRALTDGAIEIRATEPSARGRTRIRVVTAAQAPRTVEECLWELGWVSEPEWREWK